MTWARPHRDAGLVRSYVITEGRHDASRNHFDFITLVRLGAPGLSRTDLSPEMVRVLDLCRPGALSVAEIAAHLHLPLCVLRIVLADLMERGHITTDSTILTSHRPDRKVLQDVLAGLRALPV